MKATNIGHIMYNRVKQSSYISIRIFGDRVISIRDGDRRVVDIIELIDREHCKFLEKKEFRNKFSIFFIFSILRIPPIYDYLDNDL